MTDTPRVVGLDLAAECSGVALPDGTTLAITAPKPRGKKRTLLDDLDRLQHIGDTIAGILLRQPADIAVIEDYTPGIRSTAAHRLAEVGGVVRLACHGRGLHVVLVNAVRLKAYATGSARADKGGMRIAALKRAGIEFATDDECDAWWLRAMALDHYGRPPVGVPVHHRAALDKITWPEVGA